MTVHSIKTAAIERGSRMLRTALGPAIAAWLDGDAIVEVMLASATGSAADPEEQLRLQEVEAARLATLFADARNAGAGAAQRQAQPTPSPSGGLQGLFPTVSEPGLNLTGQSGKKHF